ncbi:flagellar basal body rod protein FlgC [Christensenellaceae bacterium OttesenSCG-928-M15]|nr:flagellar basal body rod protein FlgC [Christensenellaceae bacterium OttesenSCG-928-M15]
MSFMKSMEISSSGLTAQRMRMDVIAENLANINTTRTADGTTYQRRYVIMQQRGKTMTTFGDYLQTAIHDVGGRGVSVTEVRADETDFKIQYDPDHPDADEFGYVQMPNVDLAVEMVDLMGATRSYEANVTALNAFKSMALKALEI